MSKTQTIQFTIMGEEKLNCEGCEQRVSRALRLVPGIEQVQANHQTQQVQVTVDSEQLSREQVQAKLEQLGYEVSLEGAKS